MWLIVECYLYTDCLAVTKCQHSLLASPVIDLSILKPCCSWVVWVVEGLAHCREKLTGCCYVMTRGQAAIIQRDVIGSSVMLTT